MNGAEQSSRGKKSGRALDVDGCIFDLDDTLYGAARAYGSALAFLGLKSSASEYSRARNQVKAVLGHGSPASHNRLLYLKAMRDAARTSSPESLLDQMHQYEIELGRSVASQWLQLQRGPLLRELRHDVRTDRQRRFFILTNENTRTQLVKWRAIDPQAELFEFIVTSEELGCEKPDHRMFEQVCCRSSIEPQRLVMIGDHPACDLVPARDLGMRTILTREFCQHPDHHKSWDYTIDTLDALRGLI